MEDPDKAFKDSVVNRTCNKINVWGHLNITFTDPFNTTNNIEDPCLGLMFTLANSIAVSMYIIGFAESLLDMFQVNFIYIYILKHIYPPTS